MSARWWPSEAVAVVGQTTRGALVVGRLTGAVGGNEESWLVGGGGGGGGEEVSQPIVVRACKIILGSLKRTGWEQVDADKERQRQLRKWHHMLPSCDQLQL
jgi:hypothetical protein